MMERAVSVKRIAMAALVALLILATGCDPGFTIRQVAIQSQRHSVTPTAPPQVSLEVSSFHALVGSGYYTPNIQIRNLSTVPISVTAVELLTKRGTYSFFSLYRDAFAVNIDPGATREIGAWFELPEGLHETFKKPAELRVHYTIGNRAGTAIARLAGKVEAAGRP